MVFNEKVSHTLSEIASNLAFETFIMQPYSRFFSCNQALRCEFCHKFATKDFQAFITCAKKQHFREGCRRQGCVCTRLHSSTYQVVTSERAGEDEDYPTDSLSKEARFMLNTGKRTGNWWVLCLQLRLLSDIPAPRDLSLGRSSVGEQGPDLASVVRRDRVWFR